MMMQERMKAYIATDKAGYESASPVQSRIQTLLWAKSRGDDAGITSALGAIADTGAIILWPHEKEPRLLSLVPGYILPLWRQKISTLILRLP
jgi:L-lactate dehydrogenase complex protein LldG